MATENNSDKPDAISLSQKEVYAMRMEFFKKVRDPNLRRKILTIAFAYGDDTGEPHATDMMAWYLAQEENRDKIDQLALEYAGYTPREAEELGEGGGTSGDRPQGRNTTTRRNRGGGGRGR